MIGKIEQDIKTFNTDRICGKSFLLNKDRSHCHLTDKIRFPAHKKGNKSFTYKWSNFIPFVFQNLC